MILNNFNKDGTGKPVPVRNYMAEMSAAFKTAYGSSVSQMIPNPNAFNGLSKLLGAEQKKKRNK
jgi:hypothetical protein